MLKSHSNFGPKNNSDIFLESILQIVLELYIKTDIKVAFFGPELQKYKTITKPVHLFIRVLCHNCHLYVYYLLININ